MVSLALAVMFKTLPYTLRSRTLMQVSIKTPHQNVLQASVAKLKLWACTENRGGGRYCETKKGGGGEEGETRAAIYLLLCSHIWKWLGRNEGTWSTWELSAMEKKSAPLSPIERWMCNMQGAGQDAASGSAGPPRLTGTNQGVSVRNLLQFEARLWWVIVREMAVRDHCAVYVA